MRVARCWQTSAAADRHHRRHHRYTAITEILGQFQAGRAAAGGSPVQLFTKYVPNIYNQRPTPAVVEAAIKRSLNKLQVG